MKAKTEFGMRRATRQQSQRRKVASYPYLASMNYNIG
jgi:hypothetical protein